jgi:hypothetical protein
MTMNLKPFLSHLTLCLAATTGCGQALDVGNNETDGGSGGSQADTSDMSGISGMSGVSGMSSTSGSSNAGGQPTEDINPEPKAPTSADPEVCLLDRCNDGAQSQAGCTAEASAAEQCRLGSLLVVGESGFTDASGDGVVNPGETLHVTTGLLNTSTCDNFSTPGVVLTTSYPGIPNEGGFVTFLWNYGLLAGEECTATGDILIPSSVEPGTRIDFDLAPTSPCGQSSKFSVLVE